MRGEQYFAVQDFSTAVSALTKEEQEKKVGQLLKARRFAHCGKFRGRAQSL